MDRYGKAITASDAAEPAKSEGKSLVRIFLPRMWDETLLSLLEEHGFGSAVSEVRFDHGALVTDPGDPRKACEVRVVLAEEQLPALREQLSTWFTLLGIPAESCGFQEEAHDDHEVDPEVLWRAQWRPYRCAQFAVFAEFHDQSLYSLRPTDQPLTLIAGSAFGTGGHVSTRLALKVLRKWCKDSPPSRLLDVGTGSGILAIAAALSGVKEVVGMDPDVASARQATQTADLNGVGDACTFWRGGYDTVRGTWPAVMANLVADLLQEGARDLVRLLEPGGLIFAGGILDTAWQDTAQVFAQEGLQLEQRLVRGRWQAGIWSKP